MRAAAVGAHQRGGGARRPQNPQHDPPGPGGRGSRQCRPVPCERGVQQIGLEQGNLDKGWYQFEQALTSVSRYTGTQVVKVPAAFTSLRCSVCGHVDPKSRESQAVSVYLMFSTPACGCERRQEHPGRRACGHRLPENHHPCGCGGDVEAGTSRKPRGITAPTHLSGWNPPAFSRGRTSKL